MMRLKRFSILLFKTFMFKIISFSDPWGKADGGGFAIASSTGARPIGGTSGARPAENCPTGNGVDAGQE
jgi:hypothetical protein